MMIVAYICLVLVCMITGAFYSIYNYKNNIICVTAKLAGMLSCAILAIVTANLSSAIGGYSIFIIIGLLFLLCGECMSLIDLRDNKFYYYIKNITTGLGYLCFCLAGMLYASFNVFGLLLGLFLATGFICLFLALEKEKKSMHYWISQGVLMLFICIFFGQGLVLIISAPSLMSGLFYFFGGLLSVTGTIMHHLRKKEQNTIRIIANALYIVGIIATASSIFFM